MAMLFIYLLKNVEFAENWFNFKQTLTNHTSPDTKNKKSGTGAGHEYPGQIRRRYAHSLS